jgi:hypothetical protein
MARRSIEADYVIAGAGTAGLAFADVVLTHSDRTVVLVDKQARPGGHWNHAYPFVRLHQPSSYYGVTSRKLGRDQIETQGTNAGLFELATASEVLGYFEELLREQFLPSGRVTYLPMHELRDDGTAVSLLTGEVTELVATRKVVDAHYLGSIVPSMREHTPGFDVAGGARLVTPNALAEVQAPYPGYVIIGAGKTSIDACLWLIERGVDPGQITWVRPRDGWFTNRAQIQPTLKFAAATFGGYAGMLEGAANATSVDDLALRYEQSGFFLRIDEGVRPTFYRGATVSPAEIEVLREVTDVVRLGYVSRVEDGAIELKDGRVDLKRGVLFVDCTAEGLRRRMPVPIFSPGKVTIQYVVNGGQAAYSSALCAMGEVTLASDEEKNEFLAPAPITSELGDLARNFLTEITNQSHWPTSEAFQGFVSSTRLNPASEAQAAMGPEDVELAQIAEKILLNIGPAQENLARLVATL